MKSDGIKIKDMERKKTTRRFIIPPPLGFDPSKSLTVETPNLHKMPPVQYLLKWGKNARSL